MDRGRYSIFLLLIVIIILLPYLYADVPIHPNAGKTSASFLKLGIGARAVGMANTFTAVSDDVSAIYWNPAGLINLKNRQAGLSHNEHFQDIRHTFAGYVHPLKNGNVLGGAIYGLYTGKDIEARSGGSAETAWDVQITPVDYYFMTYDVAAQFSYAHRMMHILDDLSVGMSVKFIQQTIDNDSARGFGMDMGALYSSKNLPGVLSDFRFALALKNMGSGLKFVNKSYPLPFDARLGVYWKRSEKLGFAVDFSQPNDNYLFISGAAEYEPIKFIALRGGYRYRLGGLELGDITGVSAGLGMNFSQFRVDYSFTPFGVLGNSQRISIIFDFPEPAEEIAVKEKSEITQKTKGKQEIAYVETPPPVAVSTTVPSEPVIASQPSLEEKFIPDAEFRFIESSAVCKLIDISMQGMVLYSFSATAIESDIQQVTGRVRQIKPEKVKFEIGESTGIPEFELAEGEKYYKSIVFRRNFAQEIFPAEVTFRIPREWISQDKVYSVYFCTPDESGGMIRDTAEKTGEDAKYNLYKAKMGRLGRFAITVK
ncbi:MAG: PorV/PorQ family protein [Elusimicrobiota bacterium]